MDVTIRPARPDDLSAMVAIKHDAGLAAWTHVLPADVIERLPFPAPLGGRDRELRSTNHGADRRPRRALDRLCHHPVLWRQRCLASATLNHRPRRIYETAGWVVDGTERQRSFGGVEFSEIRYRRPLD